MQNKKSIVIVGAGIIGATCAYWLNKYSDHRLIILEKGAVASGTTKYSLGLRNTKVFNPELIELAKNSFRGYEELKQGILDFPEIRLPIAFFLEKNKYQTDQLFLDTGYDTIADKQFNHHSFDALANTKEVYHSFAYLGNAGNATKKILQKVLTNPENVLRENSHVSNITYKGNKIIVAVNDQTQIECDKIIYCTGPSTLFNTQFQEESPKYRTKKVACLQLAFTTPEKQGVVYLQDDKAFLVFPEDGRQAYLSYTSDEWDIEPPFDDFQFNTRDAQLSSEVLNKYFATDEYEIVKSGIHCDIYAEDWIPKIVCKNENTYFVTGSSGSGYKYAPGLAEKLTNTIINQ